ARRELTPDPAAQEWRIAGPASRGWSVDEVDRPKPDRSGQRRRCVLSWKGPEGARETSLVLGPNEEARDAVVLGPSKAAPVVLLAVAIWDARNSEPSLRLYRADKDNGVQVRQYVGHAHRISALAASSDGRLLASTGDDQTVCVWSLTDLDRILDR